MFPSLVADIGGTNARFALMTARTDQGFSFEHVKVLQGADHANFADAVEAYLSGVDVKPNSACVAIAGPVAGDQIRMTNLSWEFSKSRLQEHFGWSQFEVINDFTAVALATSRVADQHLDEIRSGKKRPNANKAVLGAGTGLGVAGLVWDGMANRWIPVPSEGGHVNVAPSSPFELEVINAAMLQHSHVSAETLLSGPGLVNLYTAICSVEDSAPEKFEPADITRQALSGDNTFCVKTLDTFCSLLGAMTGNLVLTYGATGGAYIAGGIVPRFVDYLKNSEFNTRFESKGKMSHFVADVPVFMFDYEYTAFLGAGAWLESVCQQQGDAV